MSALPWQTAAPRHAVTAAELRQAALQADHGCVLIPQLRQHRALAKGVQREPARSQLRLKRAPCKTAWPVGAWLSTVAKPVNQTLPLQCPADRGQR